MQAKEDIYMSAKKKSFFKTYIISVLIIAAATLLIIILGARLFWTRGNIRMTDDTINRFVGKISLSLSYDTNPEFKKDLIDTINSLNENDGISANIKLPDGSYIVEPPEEKQKLVDRALTDLPGLTGSEDLLGYTKYRAGIKTFESVPLKGQVTVVIVLDEYFYQIYRTTPALSVLAIGVSIGSGLLFGGLIPSLASAGKKGKKKN